ncbi:Branched-chain amino acid transport system / permease component [Neomoorella glycerini]|uniref:Branched-chain amino acid transport system / permease component n=1 Tax=Neomoorella glycerini TaxID=55779 RepID=A0A6I5ZV21_9FIRM|nr:ABC transporter permease [Moorella glycerini]QGP93636.1 Branched-chain amino acid transport system / permease component [Moorella glycerini]
MSLLISASIIQITLLIATPLFIGALGGLFCERVGVVNVGLDGIMLAGAFTAAVVSYYSQSALLGVLAAVLAGALLGVLHAFICVGLKTDHVVSGVAINILASSTTVFLLQLFFGNKGQSPSCPKIGVLGTGMAHIPLLGPLLQNMSYLTLAGLVLVIISHLFLYHTKMGLRLRAVGENPYAAQSLGVPVVKYMYGGVILGCALAGLAGAFLSVGMLNVFTKNMTAGRGFIALAAMIFGRWTPFGSLLASLFFGYVMAWQINAQGWQVPAQLVEAIPYLATLLVLAFVSRRARGPAHTGKIYIAGRH